MILVTGATGSFGASAINHLLNKGVQASEIAALVRNTEKAQALTEKGIILKQGDYTNYDSLVTAFKGIDKLLFVSGSEIENRLSQHENVVKAAKEAGVNHIVYTSFIRKSGIENSPIAFLHESHVGTEKLIEDSGIQYTILQNGVYLDMLPMFVGEKVAQSGAIMLPAQEGKASWVSRDELAEAAAHVMTTEGHEGQIYLLTNTESVTYAEVAAQISGALGKEIKYYSPSVDGFQYTLKEYGVPEMYIGLFTTFSLAQAQGELEVNDGTLESFLGRKPISVKDFISKVYTVQTF